MLFGKIVVIKRSGADGAQFPLTTSSCLFGRSNDCDIRIQLPNVSREHCRVSVADTGKVYLSNLSAVNPIRVNDKFIDSTIELAQGDVFTIIDRSFRFEVPNLTGKSPAKSPGKLMKNSLITPVKNSPNKGFATPKNVDLNETYPLKPLSPSNRKSFGGTSSKKQTGLRTLTPQPAKSSKPLTPRTNSTPADMKRTMKILTPKSKPPTPVKEQTEGNVEDKTPKKKRVQSPSPLRNTKQKGHVSRAETKGTKSPGFRSRNASEIISKSPTIKKAPMASPKQDARTSKSASRSPAKNAAPTDARLSTEVQTRTKTPTRSPSRLSQELTQENKTQDKSPSRTPVKQDELPKAMPPDLTSRSPNQRNIGNVKTPRTKTPSKSPALKQMTEDVHVRTPSKTKVSDEKTTEARSASKSQRSPSRREVKTPANLEPTTSSQTPTGNTSTRILSPTQKLSPRAASADKALRRTLSPPEVAHAKKKTSNTPKKLKSPDRIQSSAGVPTRSGSPASNTPVKSGFVTNSPIKLPTDVIDAENKTERKTARKSCSPASKTPSTILKTPTAATSRKETQVKSPKRTPSPAGWSPKSTNQLTSTDKTKYSVKVKFGGKRKSTDNNAPSAKKKRISFGPQLSPEMFDKQLPPITPVRRGTTPRRLSEPLNTSSPKSLLKRKSVASFRAHLAITEESPKKITPEKNTKTSIIEKTTPESTLKQKSSKSSPGRLIKTTPVKRSPKQAKKSPVSAEDKSPTQRSPRMASPKQSTSLAGSSVKRSPRMASSERSTPQAKSPLKKSPKLASPKQSTSPAVKKSPKVASPKTKKLTVQNDSAMKKSPKKAISNGSPVKKLAKKASPNSFITSRRSPKSVNSRLSKSFSDAKTNQAEISFTGLQELMETPKMVTSTPKATKSPKRKSSTGAVNLTGVKNLLKTPKNKLDDVSFTGLSIIMQTPEAEIKHQEKGKSDKQSPKFSSKKVKPSRTPTPHRSPKSWKKTPKSLKKTPSSAIKNAVAIRAIHGKAKTPKLQASLWSDVVKKGIGEKGIAKRQSSEKPRKVIQKKEKTPKNVQKKMPPKTPRTKAAYSAPTTGHMESPATIVIRKKQVATPAPLPRKGRKSMGLKKVPPRLDSRLSGVADMFKTPSPSNTPELSGTPHSLYSDLPETPAGPGEMIVSPISNSKRKSVPTPKLAGLKTLFKQTKRRSEMKLAGIKQLMKTPKQLKSPPSPSGIEELFQTPKLSTPEVTPANKTTKVVAASPSIKVTSVKKSSAKKSLDKKSPVARHGRKRPAPVNSDVVEVPSKQSRDVLVKRSPVNSKKKATPVKQRKNVAPTVISDDEEKVVDDAVSTDTIKPTRRRALPKLKTSPKNLKSRNSRNKSPKIEVKVKSDVKRKTRRGKIESPVKTVSNKSVTPKKSAKTPVGPRTSRRGKVAMMEPVETLMKSEEQKAVIKNSGRKGKASSVVKKVTKIATPKKSTPIKQLPSIKKLVAKRSTRDKPVEEFAQSKVLQKKQTKEIEKENSPLKKASPVKRTTRGKGKKVESPLKVEKETMRTVSPLKKPVRGGKRKRSVSPASVEPPSKKSAQVNEMSEEKMEISVKSSNKKHTRGKTLSKEATPKKMATPKEKKVVKKQVGKLEGNIVASVKTPAKRTRRGNAAKTLTPKKVAVQTEEPKVSTLKTSPKKTPAKRVTRGKLAKVESVMQSPVNGKGKNTPMKRTRGKASKRLSPKEKTPTKRTKSGGLKKSPTILLTPVKTSKKMPGKKGSRAQKASPNKPLQAEETELTNQNAAKKTASPRKPDTPVKRPTRKGGKRKATPIKVISPPKATKLTNKSAATSPAKPLKRSTRRNPKPKTPMNSNMSPKVLKTVSPKSKTPIKRVTRTRK